MKPINDYIVVRVDKAVDKIGSLYIPEAFQKRTNKGTVVAVPENIKLRKGDKVWFMEYDNSMWLDEDNIIIPCVSLNAGQNEEGIFATGSKILVEIDKQVQKSNRFVGTLKLLMPDFNNHFSFNNQFGICKSVGPNVKENIQAGDTAIFNQFIEGADNQDTFTLIETLPNENEIRVVETGTNMNYELFGYMRGEEVFSTQNYVFVEGEVRKKELLQNSSGVFMFTDENTSGTLNVFQVAHTSNDGLYKKGDIVLAQGLSAQAGKLDIRYIHSHLIKENLNGMIQEPVRVSFEEKVSLNIVGN
jgi:co-chaperonin GroES (HSP10)